MNKVLVSVAVVCLALLLAACEPKSTKAVCGTEGQLPCDVSTAPAGAGPAHTDGGTEQQK